MDDTELVWRQSGSDPGPELGIFRIRFDTFHHPEHDQPLRATVLESQPWCAVVALTAVGDVVVVRQFRFGVREVTLEIPAGLVDPGEDHAVAARRELLEETGFESNDWQYLGDCYQNPAFQTDVCHLWLARDAVQSSEPSAEPGEHIAAGVMPPEQLSAAVRDGLFRHPQGIVALSKVFDLRVV